MTIAVPTYNRAGSYLPQALKCAVNQSYKNLDIIVADNCSTDATTSLVGGISDRRLRYFRHETNIGSTNNFNFCLDRARGEYLLLLHDDDRIDHDFIEVCINAVGDLPDVGMVRTGMRWIDMDSNVLGEATNLVGGLPIEEFFCGWFTGKTPMHLCSTLFSTARLREIGGFHSKHNAFDDVLAEVRLAARHTRVDVRDVKASCRHHPHQLAVKQQISNWCEDSLILLDEMCALVPASKAGLIRDEGTKHFIRANYRRARNVPSLVGRYAAYGTVLKYFDYPIRQFISIVISLALARRTRVIKNKVKIILERIPYLKIRVDWFRKYVWGSLR